LPGSLLLAALVLSCRNGENGPSTAEADKACTRQAQIRCAKLKSCWDTAGAGDYQMERQYGTPARCQELVKNGCMESLLRKETSGTAANTEKCATALQNQSCADFIAGVALTDPACATAPGRLAEGKPCLSNSQCASAYCFVPANALCGQCGPRVQLGSSCDSTSDCVPPLTCQPDPTTGVQTCQQPVALKVVDEECTTSSQCKPGLTCVGRSGMPRLCKTMFTKEGDTCDPGRRVLADCNTNFGIFCEANPEVAANPSLAMTTPGYCVKRVVAKSGEPCNIVTDPESKRTYSATCWGSGACKRGFDPAMPTTRLQEGVCVDAVGEGEVCFASSSDGPSCISPLRCVLDKKGGPQGKCLRRDYGMCK
jgi:hypothetical protein